MVHLLEVSWANLHSTLLFEYQAIFDPLYRLNLSGHEDVLRTSLEQTHIENLSLTDLYTVNGHQERSE